VDLLDHPRPKRHPQFAQGLRIWDLARTHPGEVAVHDIGPHLALEDGETPVAHVLEQQQSQHHLRGCALAPAREAVRPAARQHLVDQLHELGVAKQFVDLTHPVFPQSVGLFSDPVIGGAERATVPLDHVRPSWMPWLGAPGSCPSRVPTHARTARGCPPPVRWRPPGIAPRRGARP
jgi:hypothetical protein